MNPPPESSGPTSLGFVQPIPPHPKCFTPCNANFTHADGTPAICGSDHLAEGCAGSNTCAAGTCVPPSSTTMSSGLAAATTSRGLDPGSPCTADKDCGAGDASDAICYNNICTALCGVSTGTCTDDTNCPDFQVCVAGTCYSNCDTDLDCPSPGECYRHACRLACSSESGDCPHGMQCQTQDGQSGYCFTVPAPAASSAPAVETLDGDYAVLAQLTTGASTTTLPLTAMLFDSDHVSGTFYIQNNSSNPLTFVVKKVSHTEYDMDGNPVVVTTNPLAWIQMGLAGATAQQEELTVTVPGTTGTDPNYVQLALTGAANPNLSRWQGEIDVINPLHGVTHLNAQYRELPAGRWTGTMYYFSSFPTTGLSDWAQLSPAAKLESANYTRVKNAFVQQWVGFKNGNGYTLDRFRAMIKSTQLESYDWPTVKQKCPGADARCIPYDNTQGYFVYTVDSGEYPVPTGMTELPIAIDLRLDATLAGSGKYSGAPASAVWSGRIVTDKTLHYAGDPRVELAFATDPTACPTNGADATLCQVIGFNAEITVGGRFLIDAGDSCGSFDGTGRFAQLAVPWLIPGFLAGIGSDAAGNPVRYECRDNGFPYSPAVTNYQTSNESIAAANPIPDGSTRHRSLQLLDGFLVDQSTLVIMFQEKIPSFFGQGTGSDLTSSGFMVLGRTPTDLAASDFVTNDQSASPGAPASDLLGVSCSGALSGGDALNPGDGAAAVRAANYVLGAASVFSGPELPQFTGSDTDEVAHYLCVETGQFDGARDPSAPSSNDPDARIPCPVTSQVKYFTLVGAADSLRDLACNSTYTDRVTTAQTESGPVTTRLILTAGTCGDILNFWKTQPGYHVRQDPAWRCRDTSAVYCDDRRTNLLADKQFYPAPTGAQLAALIPLQTQIDDAFQYKTQFTARSGSSLGFAPQICAEGVNYCYRPDEIQLIRDRVDCLAWLYTNRYDELNSDPSVLRSVRDFLQFDFSYDDRFDKDGFERLYAELLTMLGDEAYTSASAARFDLAGSALHSFDGQAFEGNDGISLTGGAGFEMYQLYLSTEYYQLALERLYRLAPTIWESIAAPNHETFITNASVSSYFNRVIGASTHKARAWSDIARRYQDYNQPELARRVLIRGYTSAYLEALVASSILESLENRSALQNAAEIAHNLDLAARQYRSSLSDMSDLYSDITNDRTVFGFPPDYIPFPPLQPDETNAFEKILSIAKDKMAFAATKEQVALASRRDFDTDEAAFQNELVRIKNDYENQIADACGTFIGDDGKRYPATSVYAYASQATAKQVDPCGLVGNGTIHEAIADVDLKLLDLQKAVQAQDNTQAEIDIENSEIASVCGTIDFIIAGQEAIAAGVGTLGALTAVAEGEKVFAHNWLTQLGVQAQLGKCNEIESTDCLWGEFELGEYDATSEDASNLEVAAAVKIAKLQAAKEVLEQQGEVLQSVKECQIATIERKSAIKRDALQLTLDAIEILRAEDELRLAESHVVKERNAAIRLIQQESEAADLAIDIEAARNDPNVRIYKNDDILNAERTFRDAVTEAYEATKVYEYYTSQSYGKLNDLFLVRLVQHGDISLENYLTELEESFRSFEDSYGLPDQRVAIVSVKDDVLQIPRLNARTLTPICDSDRAMLFRRALQDIRWVDNKGYITLNFATTVGQVSPLTRDHKLFYVEAEFVGSNVGDELGRIYLRPKGTSTVRSVSGDKSYYTFPARTAVVNTFFNGRRAIPDNIRTTSVYSNFRLRDQPFANSNWEVVINKKDEAVNADIDLGSLTDIRLYLYYQDFTSLE